MYLIGISFLVGSRRDEQNVGMYLAGVLSGGIQKEIQDMMTMRTEGMFRMWECTWLGCFLVGSRRRSKT